MEICNKLQGFVIWKKNIYIHDNKINKTVRMKAEDSNVQQFESLNKLNQF